MKCFEWANLPGIVMALAALYVGIRAALIWKNASAVPTDPGWRTGPPIGESDTLRPSEPLDPVQAQMDWIVAIMEANAKSAALNRRAAIWTAWAVGLSVASSVLGVLAFCR